MLDILGYTLWTFAVLPMYEYVLASSHLLLGCTLIVGGVNAYREYRGNITVVRACLLFGYMLATTYGITAASYQMFRTANDITSSAANYQINNILGVAQNVQISVLCGLGVFAGLHRLTIIQTILPFYNQTAITINHVISVILVIVYSGVSIGYLVRFLITGIYANVSFPIYYTLTVYAAIIDATCNVLSFTYLMRWRSHSSSFEPEKEKLFRRITAVLAVDVLSLVFNLVGNLASATYTPTTLLYVSTAQHLLLMNKIHLYRWYFDMVKQLMGLNVPSVANTNAKASSIRHSVSKSVTVERPSVQNAK